jgi:hypothetical protein
VSEKQGGPGMYIPDLTHIRCSQCSSENVARKILPAPRIVPTLGPLVCLDCGHEEKRCPTVVGYGPKEIAKRRESNSRVRVIEF